MNDTLTSAFVDRIRSIRFETLPAAAVDIARQVALDGLGVMLAGSQEPLGLGRIVTDYARRMGGAAQASVIAGGFKTSMPNAAFANGCMAHALDWDNTWYPLNHPTSPTLPAILALAEHMRLSGAKVVEAIVTAFEVQARVRLAATDERRIPGSGFHWPGTTGMFGAVAACARLLDLDHAQTVMAFGIAGSRAGGMSINTGTMTKSSHSGNAARMGVECALLAQAGWTASADVFGPKGFFDTFMSGDMHPELLLQDFAAPLRMVSPGVGFKKHPCNYFTHRPVDAALALRERHGLRGEDIEHVEVVFPRVGYVLRAAPESGLDGKFSVQYTTALALLDGEIGVESFTNARRFAADVEALLPRVQISIDDGIPPDFDRMHAEVRVTLKDGRRLSERVKELTGWVGFPLSREQRLKKFDVCTRGLLQPAAVRRLVECVERLDTLPDIAEIMDRVRRDAG
jgi:aconitate decarboxylase